MSAGTDASNLGYGNITPLSNINGKLVNIDNSHYPGMFGSNQVPGLPGLSGAKINTDAANSYVPGICLFKGGGMKKFKKKINKISRKYKMKNKSCRSRNKRSLRHKYSRRVHKKHSKKHYSKKHPRKQRRHRSKKMRGGMTAGNIPYPPGYAQFQNNQPLTGTYSVGGQLSPANLSLANPPPIHRLPMSTNCTDNYNHFTGKGFTSRGH
jgi:hypothetical protein